MMDLAGQCAFFDWLADLVDPRFYGGEEREPANTKFLKAAQRAATKAAFKEAYKQNKRARLDPDAAKTTTQLQEAQAAARQQQHEQQEQQQQRHGGGEGGGAMGRLHLAPGGQPSREELLRRLHAKMEAARAARHAKDGGGEADKPKGTADSAKQWRKEQLGKKLKAKQQQQQQQQQQDAPQKRRQPEQAGSAPAAKKPKQQQQQQQQGGGAKLSFNKLVVEAGRPGGPPAKGKKPTKQEALRAAEEQRARLKDAEARQDKEAISAAAWRAALSRASGERVLDDPKLLRRSIKRESADKARKAKRWQERVSAQQEQQRARQDKRKDNLAARAATKQDNKKAKREKKLLRAGFEGRKSGFINAAPSKGK